jgi:uncharacterized protein YdcH (DUF465 family)
MQLKEWLIAQQQYRLTQQSIDSKIVGLTQLINSQNKTLELTQNQAKFMHEIGNKVEFTRLLEKYNELSAKIEFNQDELRERRSSVDKVAILAEVSAFLTCSRKAMNMEAGDLRSELKELIWIGELTNRCNWLLC